MELHHDDEPLNADLLRGADAISRFTGENIRRVFYLLETRQLPAGKQGNTWLASKSALREHYHRLTSGAPDAPVQQHREEPPLGYRGRWQKAGKRRARRTGTTA
jgi:hypothetical protein